jgi:hypothetical protein
MAWALCERRITPTATVVCRIVLFPDSSLKNELTQTAEENAGHCVVIYKVVLEKGRNAKAHVHGLGILNGDNRLDSGDKINCSQPRQVFSGAGREVYKQFGARGFHVELVLVVHCGQYTREQPSHDSS